MSNKTQNLQNALKYMIQARALDTIEQEYTARGEAFFHVSGGGHEGIAVLDVFLEKQDWVHAHYRDKSLLLSRGVSLQDYFQALFNKEESHSKGRQMNSHMSAREHQIFSLAGPVGNSQSQAAGAAASIKDNKDNPIVVCGAGDGATAQGEFLEGLFLSIRDSLPLITIIEDNNFAISSNTDGKTFFKIGDRDIDHFMGCHIHRIDGRKPHDAYDVFEKVVSEVRKERKPAIIIFSVERLDSHTNADDHKIYRDNNEIETIKNEGDPIIQLISYLYEENTDKAKKRLDAEVDTVIKGFRADIEEAQHSTEPDPIFTAKDVLPLVLSQRANEMYEEGSETMMSAIRNVLDTWLEKDARVFLYGEDIEDPKGDVFGLTRGLSTAYPNRVVNSPLSESLIVGACVGRALVGEKPVAFLQFADFLPLIVNQLYSELGSMFWRTNGDWKVPVIILATSGGYKPGLGPFHAASFEALVSHIPGIDVFAPSNAADAAGLLNAAFLSERPTVFFYPKNLLNNKVRNISAASSKTHVIMPGKAKVIREGNDITLVGYGNTISLCEKAADTIAQFGKSAEVIDLRSISPLDHDTIITSVKKTNTILVVHEENGSMGVGAEVLARVGAAIDSIKMRRLTRRDTHIPCNFVNQIAILPSYKKIVEDAVDMMHGTIEWVQDETKEDGITAIEAIGGSPSDETFTMIEWKIKKGDTIQAGDLIAEAEADKADIAVKSVVSGVVEDILIEDGDSVNIGTNIALIKTDEKIFKTITREETGVPHIIWNTSSQNEKNQSIESNTKVYIGYHNAVLGSNIISNEQLSEMSPDWDAENIQASTGIISRHWIGEDQTLVSMPADAARVSLAQAGLKITDITGIICATGTNDFNTPSVAAQVQYELLKDETDEQKRMDYKGFAYDISAACSGYIYALSNAYNRIKVDPSEKILVITAETLSKHLNMNDYNTAPIFGDAGCACIISSEPVDNAAELGLPVLEAIGEPAKTLTVHTTEPIYMDGIEVYKVAVANLKHITEVMCKKNNLNINDIDMIVPHQANLKIIKGVARRLKIDIEKFYVNISEHGNTSSCTIPICLSELEEAKKLKGKKVMTIAFGGGYTFAASILQY